MNPLGCGGVKVLATPEASAKGCRWVMARACQRATQAECVRASTQVTCQGSAQGTAQAWPWAKAWEKLRECCGVSARV